MTRLLFDENLSPRLVSRLAKVYPGSLHVRDLQLLGGTDEEIWSRARSEGLVIVTKDDDFKQLSFLRGAPPKVIWLVVGNRGTEEVARVIEAGTAVIATFIAHPEESLLLLRARGD